MDLSSYIKVLVRWWKLLVLGVAVAVGSTYLAVRNQPPTYQAKATLMVGTALQQQEPSQADIYLAQALATSYAEVARRRPVQEATMAALGLEWLPGYTVQSVVNTQLLEIRVIDTDPVRAAVVANELAKQLILETPTYQGEEEAQRQAFVKEQLDDLEASIQTTNAEVVKLQKDLAGLFSAREIAATQTQINALQQKLRDAQNNYALFLQYMGEGAVNTLSMVEEAVPSGYPIGASKSRTLLMSAAVGLALAVATAFLLEYMDDTIKTPEDVEKAMHVTTLAGISRIPGEKLITVKHPKSPISEAYRALRTNLQFSSVDKPLRTLVVTSPNPTEGKSTTVANLAVVMAQAGKKVILVDADLRRPVLHRIFDVENADGLTTALLNPEPALDGHLQATGVENLRLLNTGPLPPNPSELLGSQRMATLIERLKEEADLVMFDSPPSLAVTDANVLAAQADGVLLVADAGRTRRSLARQAAERLQAVTANLVGVALNRVRPGRGGYYYYYYYYHRYGYGEGGRRPRPRRGVGTRPPRPEPPARDAGGGVAQALQTAGGGLGQGLRAAAKGLVHSLGVIGRGLVRGLGVIGRGLVKGLRATGGWLWQQGTKLSRTAGNRVRQGQGEYYYQYTYRHGEEQPRRSRLREMGDRPGRRSRSTPDKGKGSS